MVWRQISIKELHVYHLPPWNCSRALSSSPPPGQRDAGALGLMSHPLPAQEQLVCLCGEEIGVLHSERPKGLGQEPSRSSGPVSGELCHWTRPWLRQDK